TPIVTAFEFWADAKTAEKNRMAASPPASNLVRMIAPIAQYVFSKLVGLPPSKCGVDCRRPATVRYWPLAYIPSPLTNVPSGGKADIFGSKATLRLRRSRIAISCPLLEVERTLARMPLATT